MDMLTEEKISTIQEKLISHVIPIWCQKYSNL